MTTRKQVPVPDLGGFESVDVIDVHIQAGDTVEKEDPLITLESDKAAMDVPAPFGGKVTSVAVQSGDKVSEGDAICEMEVAGETQTETRSEKEKAERRREKEQPEQEEEKEQPEQEEEKEQPEQEEEKEQPEQEEEKEQPEQEEEKEQPEQEEEKEQPEQEEKEKPQQRESIHASPGTRRLAREKDVDLRGISGSGRKGRITKEDVERAARRGQEETGGEKQTAALFAGARIEDFSRYGKVDEKPLSAVRKRGAQNLAASWPRVPQVTQHGNADVTELEDFRKELKSEAKKRDVHLTMMAFMMKATVSALQEYPMFNSSLAAGWESVILKKYYHLSVAVDTEQGLVVPVVRDVDRKGVFALAGELMDKSERARQFKLALDEVKGGNFSITNLGSIGGTAFTPIVYAPQVAVLGLSRAENRPVWNEAEQRFVPRRILPLSLSYDHRVIDGASAARFVVYLAGLLGDVRRLVL